ncbi:hypothetical protein Tco_0735108, partial [Tanacetum coccineum]
SSAGYAETLEKDLADLRSKDIDAEVASGGRRMYVSMSPWIVMRYIRRRARSYV